MSHNEEIVTSIDFNEDDFMQCLKYRELYL